jgi:hypothetical protein
MRYTIFFVLVTCAAAQAPVAPIGPVRQLGPLAGGAQQHRVFQTPDWLKKQFHINPASPEAALGVVPFGAPGVRQFALPHFGAVPGTVTECAIPLTPVHPPPGWLFRTPVVKPNAGPPLKHEVTPGLRVCGQPG